MRRGDPPKLGGAFHVCIPFMSSRAVDLGLRGNYIQVDSVSLSRLVRGL